MAKKGFLENMVDEFRDPNVVARENKELQEAQANGITSKVIKGFAKMAEQRINAQEQALHFGAVDRELDKELSKNVAKEVSANIEGIEFKDNAPAPTRGEDARSMSIVEQANYIERKQEYEAGKEFGE